MNSYPKTPTPGRFLPSKRLTQFSSQTPAPPRFTPTPRFGSSASKPTQSTSTDAIEDDEDSTTSSEREEAQLEIDPDAEAEADSDAYEDEDEDGHEGAEEGTRGRAKGKSMADAIDAEADWFAPPARGTAQWMHSDALESEAGEWDMRRATKRRRMGSKSPSVVPDSPLGRPPEDDVLETEKESEMEGDREGGGFVPMSSLADAEGVSAGESQDVLGDGRMETGKMAMQPVFQTAPRFKPVGVDVEEGDGMPAGVFSPRRRGEKYVAGGLAAGLQGWLYEVKGWEGVAWGDATSGFAAARAGPASLRARVEEVRVGGRMCLVEGRLGGSGEELLRRFVLAGEGRSQGLERAVRVSPGSVVVIGQPMWDIELDGREWTVVCDWAVE